MKIIFFGNTRYSTTVEASLYANFGLSAIVTIPDQPLGRNKVMTPTPTKAFANEHKLRVIETLKLDKQTINKIEELQPDFLVVDDYRLFLPKELLEVPTHAALNVHHSLLPKYRGPSPAPAVILAGEKVSGVTIMQMAQTLDAGNILAQKDYILNDEETSDSLLTTLNELAAKALIPIIKDFESYKIKAISQDERQSSFTPHISKQDGFVNLQNPPSPEQFDRMVRAYFPWPNVWTKLVINQKETRIKFLPKQHIQIEGKKPVDLNTFYRGYPQLRASIKNLYAKGELID